MKNSFLTALLFVVTLVPASAAVLDWDSVAYPAGSLSQTFNNVDGSGTNINITFTGSTGSFVGANPQINQLDTGGLVPAEDSLRLLVDFFIVFQTVTMTVTFSDLVQNVDFTVFDIDFNAGDFQDNVTDNAQNVYDGTSSDPSITNGTANTIIGTDTVRGLSTSGPTSSAGNGTFDFGTTPITSFTLVYGNGPAAPFTPRTITAPCSSSSISRAP